MQMGDLLVSTGLKDAGYNRVNVDGGWTWTIEINGTYFIQRYTFASDPILLFLKHRSNETGYLLPDPVKFPEGIQVPIDYLHSLGIKYGHYTNAGVNACGGAVNSSENWLQQDVSLFDEWKIGMHNTQHI